MSKKLELKRLKSQINKAISAISEYEFKIEERMEDITRMEEQIEAQKKAIENLKSKYELLEQAPD